MYSGCFLMFVLLEHVPSVEFHSCPPKGAEVEATDEGAVVVAIDENAAVGTTDKDATDVGVVAEVA